MEETRSFQAILQRLRQSSLSEYDKGSKFERLMQRYLQTDPLYAPLFKHVWLWSEFPFRSSLGGSDTGIDLVAFTHDGQYWAIQCKFYHESTRIDKQAVDSFISTSSRQFKNDNGRPIPFSIRLWISTTNKWGPNAEEAILNHQPEVTRLSLNELEAAPVNWLALESGLTGEASRSERKIPYPHQLLAVKNAAEYYESHDRGKLIMACGTGKTYTSLKIAEKETGGKGLVLFLVPSIALLAQTLREWTAETSGELHSICICSDAGVSTKKTKIDGPNGFTLDALAVPASTNVKQILAQFEKLRINPPVGLTVVFSTYQSIGTIAAAQTELLVANSDENLTFGIFDLIICDEAHRTTGYTLAGDEEAAFVKVHDNQFLQTKKRLYMTATPRLYNEESKSKAAQSDAVLCSMDDEAIYGTEIYRIGFGEAVEKNLLSDYKVLILTISESEMPMAIQRMLSDSENKINADDASKIIGCINALSKQVLGDAGILKATDPDPMRRAVAFCQNIASSKKITETFNDMATVYTSTLKPETEEQMVSLHSRHVDGKMSSTFRDLELSWLKETPENPRECRVLTNVRCLSEGVDVPSLDAVLFLSAKNSQIDVVQSVGRVMRKAPDKKYGYIIIPVVVPAHIEADIALDSNEQYKVVWSVLNALRAHDDRFNTVINKIDLNKQKPSQILVARIPAFHDTYEDPIAQALASNKGSSLNDGSPSTVNDSYGEYARHIAQINQQIALDFEQYQNVVFARMVEKVGNRRYWEQWANDVAGIAARYIIRINELIEKENTHQQAFANFLAGLQKNINPSISQQEAVEMLAQHFITRPVFEALFDGYSFVKNNPISVSMQQMLDLLEEQALEKDLDVLKKFYDSVKSRANGIDNAVGKQKIIVELYDKFFKTAFPKMVEKLGIVYTPVEVVDFIIHSVNDLLKKEFGRSLSDENVHVLDPFTGTGTFMTRLLQSGLIEKKDIERKYRHELHANEIVLLAYYIAAINIENTYHDSIQADQYEAFEGICLTDTFQLGESSPAEQKGFKELFPQNSERVQKQKSSPIQIIIGNPPYSVGQKSANDNSQNQRYLKLDSAIAETYVKLSNANLNKSLYDAYIKAFRWSTDRLSSEYGGIIAFVTNGAWIDGNSTDGFRKSLEEDFSSIYVFNLRGNQRTSGEMSKKEGGKIFGAGSRTPISITFLIKKPGFKERAKIKYYDIGDYHTQKEKLTIIKNFHSASNPKMQWNQIQTNVDGDWIDHRNNIFNTLLSMAPEFKFNSDTQSFFTTYAIGVASNRDNWVYNFSKSQLVIIVSKMIDFYNVQSLKCTAEFAKIALVEKDLLIKENALSAPNVLEIINKLISSDPKEISWTVNLKNDLVKKRIHKFDKQSLIIGQYRPFCKQWNYFSNTMIERPGINKRLFPNPNFSNLVICVSGVGGSKNFSTILSDCIPDLQVQFNGQCFPLYYYEEQKERTQTLFDSPLGQEYIRHDGVSDFILKHARGAYGHKVTKEDIFYYVYGLLHSPEYCEKFSSDLKKMLPRIPLVEDTADFWAFSKAGKELGSKHVNYESVPPADCVMVSGTEAGNFRVEKMKFLPKTDKSKIFFNNQIVIENIPAEAYDYIVNGKSAIEWIMERYQVTTHKESQIKNDPNDWAPENPRYILDLLLSIIQVSLDTMKVVKSLPSLKLAD